MGVLKIAVALTLAQGIATQVQPAAVSGTVVKQGTGEPLSKATVSLVRDAVPVYSATTDAAGTYAFSNIAPGQYRIAAVRNGFLRSEYGDQGSNGCGARVSLAAGQRMTDAGIAMMPASVISGRLYDMDREGMPNVAVHALRLFYENATRVLRIVQTVRTNDRGEYRLFGLTPGRYYIASALESRMTVPARDVELVAFPRGLPENPPNELMPGSRYLPAYFPGTPDPAAANAIELRPGENADGIDMTVTLSPTFRIIGKVTSAVSADASRSISVGLFSPNAHPDAGDPLRIAAVTPDGNFQIPFVVPGSYLLMLSGKDTAGRLTGRVPVEVVDKDVPDVAIEATRGFELKGRVTFDDPQLIGRIREIRLRSVNPTPSLSGYTDAVASVDRTDGSFKLQGIMAGDYLPFLTIGAPADIFVKTLRLGSVDIRDGIRLDSQPASDLEIAVGNKGGIVQGTVVNDRQQPVAGATVVLVPDVFLRKRSTLYKIRTSDASGRFRIDAIAPGDYKIFAWEEIESGSWQDPDVLRAVENRGKALSAREGLIEDTQVSVIASGGPIYGQCANPLPLIK